MIQSLSYYEITQPDGGGMRDEVVARVATKALAKEAAAIIGNGWGTGRPADIREHKTSVKIAETLDEIDHPKIKAHLEAERQRRIDAAKAKDPEAYARYLALRDQFEPTV